MIDLCSRCERFSCCLSCKKFNIYSNKYDAFTFDYLGRCYSHQASTHCLLGLTVLQYHDVMYSQEHVSIMFPSSFYSPHIQHLSHSSCVYLSPLERRTPRPCWSPGKGPGTFTETDMRICGMQSVQHSGECARHIFMANHSEVQWMAYNEHGELCTLYQ